jgi:hypothetical protein
MNGTGNGGKVGQRIADQFSFWNFWNRLGRVVTVLLGGIVTLQRLPANAVEWAGVGVSVAGAIWTSERKEES